MFRDVRRTNRPTFVCVVLFAALLPVTFFYLLPEGRWYAVPGRLSYGLLEFDTLLNAAAAGIIVAFVRFASNVRPRDLGLSSDLVKAAVFTVLLWTLTQAALMVWQLIFLGGLRWNGAWSEAGPTVVVGQLTSQVLGNALYEEIVFRGFVFVQLYLFLTRRDVRSPLVKAVLASQLFFALLHIPLQLVRYDVGWSGLVFWLPATGAAGVIFAAVYARTQNLFIAVGLHALFNAPTQLFLPPTADSQMPATLVTLLGLGLVFLPGSRRLWRREAFFTP